MEDEDESGGGEDNTSIVCGLGVKMRIVKDGKYRFASHTYKFVKGSTYWICESGTYSALQIDSIGVLVNLQMKLHYSLFIPTIMGIKRMELYNLSCWCNEAFWVENSVEVHYSPCLLYIGKKKCRGTLFLTSIVEAMISVRVHSF